MTRTKKEITRRFYDARVTNYITMYDSDYSEYPTNQIRLGIISKRLSEIGAKSVLDVGCGPCIPMIKLLDSGFDVRGVDFSKPMIAEGKRQLDKHGYDQNLIQFGDLENNIDLPKTKFDAVIALGVFPHIIHQQKALENIRRRVKRNGRVYIEFRNALFAAFSMNGYSTDFFLDLVRYKTLPPTIRRDLESFYSSRLGTNIDKSRLAYENGLAMFNNPLTISDIFKPAGFSVEQIHFIHYHIMPPIFEKKYPKLFHKKSLAIEDAKSWKGHFLASAFMVEGKTI